MAPPLQQLTHAVLGRDELLATVSASVRDRQRSVIVLHGAGGNGKTTLALQVAQDLGDEVSVWWVDASSEVTLIGGLREVALQAGADPQQLHQAWTGHSSAPDLLWRCLDQLQSRWLLVLDNADDPRLLAAAGYRVSDGNGWLRKPRSDQGAVLVTSRDANPATWAAHAVLHAVAPLNVSDGARLLLNRAPKAGSAAGAEQLAQRLGGSPLALHVAGTYLATVTSAPPLPGFDRVSDFAGYRAALDERLLELTEIPGLGGERRERELLHRTWELSLDLLVGRGQPMARTLLRLLSSLAATPVPHALLDSQLLSQSALFDSLTPRQLAELVGALRDMDLLDAAEVLDGDRGRAGGHTAIGLHPVIRDASRQQSDFAEHRDAYTELGLKLLLKLTRHLDDESPDSWKLWRLLLPHCFQVLEFFIRPASPVDHEVRGRQDREEQIRRLDRSLAVALCRRAAAFCKTADLSNEAHVLYKALVADSWEHFGPDHRDTLWARLKLGETLMGMKKIGAAKAEFGDVLSRASRTLGSDHIDTLGVRRRIADIFCLEGDLANAETELRDVLARLRHVLGFDHVVTFATRRQFAHVLQEQGDLVGAEVELRDLLARQRHVLGFDHSDTIYTQAYLASLLARLNDFPAAEVEARAVLDARTRVFGTDHPDTLSSRHYLAYLLWRRGELADAEAEFRENLAVQVRVYGPEHLNTLKTRHGLAGVLRKLGELAEAEHNYREVLAGWTRILGPKNHDTLTVRHNLASLLFSRGELVAAEVEFRWILEARIQLLGLEHPGTLATRHFLGAVLLELGEFDAAKVELGSTLEARVRVLGEDHPDTVSVRNYLSALDFPGDKNRLFRLLGLGSVSDFDPAAAWRPRPIEQLFRVAIGVDKQGCAVELDIKETMKGGDGPHGLCIGSTGSGRVEFLRTLILSLMAMHPPDLLNFVLVSPSRAFPEFETAPHVSARISDFSPDDVQIDRMVEILNGELFRRQELLSQVSAKNVWDYRKIRDDNKDLPKLPALLVVIDQFDLMSLNRRAFDLFLLIARLGRSLQVHLLLSADRLAEDTLKQIDPHLSYRIGLKTFSSEESNFVIGTPDAADLPATGGHGFLKSPSGMKRFRAAFVSARLEQTAEAELTDLQFAVRRMANHGPRAQQLWPPPA
ncbi:tetratricopeptide repeat protein [Saccharopolyspora sp. 5N708]|uniref:tetratricopeptide repeat protein n=1 Tax=Saccharopolyspora sp. 5N708 TaxID=3457424 RepID=UPI003FD37574